MKQVYDFDELMYVIAKQLKVDVTQVTLCYNDAQKGNLDELTVEVQYDDFQTDNPL